MMIIFFCHSVLVVVVVAPPDVVESSFRAIITTVNLWIKVNTFRNQFLLSLS